MHLSAQDGTLLDSIKNTAPNIESLLDEESAGGEDFDEEAFWDEYEGPDIGVIYNEKSESDFLVIETETEITEYHYLSRIKENNLVNILTDLLKRITQDKYIYASDFSVEYGTYEDIALIYKIDKTSATGYGIAQFPQFRIVLSGKKVRDAAHPYDISSYRVLSTMVMKFIFVMSEVESTLGINQYSLLQLFSGNDDEVDDGSGNE
jgi:hypothetical protein